MKKVYFCISIVFLLFIITQANASEKVTVAVLDITPKGVPTIVSKAVSDIIRSEFVNIANFTVVERSQMKAILSEQEFQMSGCTDDACAVKVGRLLSARRMVVGEINSIGKKIYITIRYVDVEKGISLFSEREKAGSIDDIDDTAVKIAKKLAQRIVQGDKEILTIKSPTEYYVRSFVPGLGQVYADRPGKGIAFASLFVLSGVGAFLAYNNYQSKDDAYHNEVRGSDTFDSKYNDYEKAGNILNVSLVLIGAVYAIHWIDVLFFSKPDFSRSEKSVSQENSDGPLFVRMNIDNGQTFLPERKFGFTIGMRY